jgi:hypothetical protein
MHGALHHRCISTEIIIGERGKNKQAGVLDKDKIMDNVQTVNICTNVP